MGLDWYSVNGILPPGNYLFVEDYYNLKRTKSLKLSDVKIQRSKRIYDVILVSAKDQIQPFAEFLI